jgi:hypothetical protein
MPTVIDSLIVQLGLDATKFTQGQKDAVASFKRTSEESKAQAKAVEESARKTSEALSGAKDMAVGLFTVLAGTSMFNFARQTMSSVAATGRLANNIGVATADVSAFGKMIERNGGSADAAAGSLQNLTSQVEQFNVLGEASQDLQLFLGTIGGKQGDSALDDYMKFAAWAQQHKDDPKLVNLIGGMGGLDQGSINQAMKGSVQVLKDFAEAKKLAISPEDAKRMQDLQNSWVTLEQTIESVGRDLLMFVADPAKSFADWASKSVHENRAVADSIGAILIAITGLAALKPAAWVLRLLGLGGVANGISAAGGAVAAVAVPLAGIAAVGATLFVPSNKSDEPALYKRNPETGKMELTPASAGGLNGSPAGGGDVQSRMMAYFQSQGWTKNQSAAIVGNAKWESGLKPGAENRAAGIHKGLFQWSKSRRDQILAATGTDVWSASADDQAKAAQWELTHTEKKAADSLKRIDDAHAGAIDFNRNFERSEDPPEKEMQRGLLASAIARDTPSAPAAPSTTEVTIGSVVVHTQAKDADGMARDAASALKKNIVGAGIATQANSGLN